MIKYDLAYFLSMVLFCEKIVVIGKIKGERSVEEQKKIQMSESFLIASLLALVGGFFDAYTYVCRDQVFANAHTGNVVRVGMTLASGEYLKTIRYFISIVAFCLGTMLAVFIRNYCKNKPQIHW